MTRIGDLLDTGSAVRIVGVHDGLSARLATNAGARALWASGLCIAATKGLPDNEVMTYETLARRVEDIRRTTPLPLVVDVNAGFGDHQVTAHVVNLLAHKGVDAVALEDKAFPRRNSFDGEGTTAVLERPEVFARKLGAALAARAGDSPMIVARTEGFIAGEAIEAVLARARAYCAAGAEAIIVHSKAPHAEEVLQFARRWDGPANIVVIPTMFPTLSFAAAAAAGIAGVICANQVMRASIHAAEHYLAELMAADSISDCAVPITPMSRLLDTVDSFAGSPARP